MDLTKEDGTRQQNRIWLNGLDVIANSVEELSVTEKDFPDMSLGAPDDGEMSAQMISTGWEIKLGVDGKTYEYRADKFHCGSWI